jgi:hypothetical protein
MYIHVQPAQCTLRCRNFDKNFENSCASHILDQQKNYKSILEKAHLTAMQKSRVRIRPHFKLCQSLGGLPPGMAEYCVLASEGRQRYKTKLLKNPQNIQKQIF